LFGKVDKKGYQPVTDEPAAPTAETRGAGQDGALPR